MYPLRDYIVKRDSLTTSSRIKKRAITYNSCTTAQTSSLKTSVADAISMATAAYTAAGTAAYYCKKPVSFSSFNRFPSILNDVEDVLHSFPSSPSPNSSSDDLI